MVMQHSAVIVGRHGKVAGRMVATPGDASETAHAVVVVHNWLAEALDSELLVQKMAAAHTADALVAELVARQLVDGQEVQVGGHENGLAVVWEEH